ncbi:MAG: AMP-binding protein [Burkholderiales bacterium]|nr:AMP-binding protein [Burkholderiales bacterium]
MLHRLTELAQRQGTAPFVAGPGDPLSFGACHDTVRRTATWLRQQGVARGDRILVVVGNRPLFLYLWLGAMAAGAVPVPANTELTAADYGYLIRHSGARLLLAERDLEGMRPQADPAGACRFLALDEARLEAETRGLPAADLPPSEPAEIVSILYTSGTTGRPKGVTIPNESYLAIGRMITSAIGITAADRVMVFLPLFHANPQMYAVMSALTVGCSLVLCPRFSVSTFLDTARASGATGFTYVGTVLSILAKHFGEEAPAATGLRWCVGGGAPPKVWQRIETALGVRVHELYGMTETGGMVTINSQARARFGSVGAVREDFVVVVVDDGDHPLEPGRTGEIAVRPLQPHVMTAGYFEQPEETVNASGNLWFHTGDLGRFDADGFLYFEGRKKDLIRRAGEMISPAEIELAALSHPSVRDCAAVGVPDEILEEEIKLVAVPRGALDPLALVRHLEERLPRHKLPRLLELAEAILKTPTEKVKRFEMKIARGPVTDLRPLLRGA